MGEIADMIIDGTMFPDGSWHGTSQGYPRGGIGGSFYQYRFKKTKDSKLYGVLNYLSHPRFIELLPSTEAAYNILHVYNEEILKIEKETNHKNDLLTPIVEEIQKNFNKFKGWILKELSNFKKQTNAQPR